MPKLRSSLVLALLLAAQPAAAIELSGKVAREFRQYQKKVGPKAFAANGGAAYSYVWDWRGDDAEARALKACEANRKALRETAPCVIVDVQR